MQKGNQDFAKSAFRFRIFGKPGSPHWAIGRRNGAIGHRNRAIKPSGNRENTCYQLCASELLPRQLCSQVNMWTLPH